MACVQFSVRYWMPPHLLKHRRTKKAVRRKQDAERLSSRQVVDVSTLSHGFDASRRPRSGFTVSTCVCSACTSKRRESRPRHRDVTHLEYCPTPPLVIPTGQKCDSHRPKRIQLCYRLGQTDFSKIWTAALSLGLKQATFHSGVFPLGWKFRSGTAQAQVNSPESGDI